VNQAVEVVLEVAEVVEAVVEGEVEEAQEVEEVCTFPSSCSNLSANS